jgi:hypothetical protein
MQLLTATNFSQPLFNQKTLVITCSTGIVLMHVLSVWNQRSATVMESVMEESNQFTCLTGDSQIKELCAMFQVSMIKSKKDRSSQIVSIESWKLRTLLTSRSRITYSEDHSSLWTQLLKVSLAVSKRTSKKTKSSNSFSKQSYSE